MSWATSPAATELEQHVMDWLADLLGLPESFRSTGSGGGVIQDSSSGANLVALLAALHRASRAPRCGTASLPDEYTVYVSAETHSLDGEGRPHRRPRHRRHPGRRGRRRPGDEPARRWPQRLERDVARGFTPVLVCATVGTTSTTAIDPLAELGPICQRHGVWLHVDAAYAGVSAVAPELRGLHAGVEWADCYTTDAHKWLLTGFDATLFWVADRAALTGALSILPEYLRNAATDSGAVVDYRDWQIPLGRRFRALKLWFVLRWYGAEGLREHVRGHVALAQELAGWAAADDRFEVATPHPLSLVCLRPRWAPDVDADVATMTLLDRLVDGGEVFLTHTTVGGSAVLRVAIGAPATTREHVRAGLDAAVRGPRLAGQRLRGAGAGAPGGRAPRAARRPRRSSAPAARPRRPPRRPQAAAAEDATEPEQLVVPPVEVPTVETPASGDESAAQATAQEDLEPQPGTD